MGAISRMPAVGVITGRDGINLGEDHEKFVERIFQGIRGKTELKSRYIVDASSQSNSLCKETLDNEESPE